MNSSHNSLSYWRKNALTLTVYTQGSQKCPLSLQIDPFQSCLGEVFSMWLAALDLLLGWEAVLHGWQPHTGWEKGRQRTVLPVWALCSWNGKMKQFLSVIVPFKLGFVYSHRKNGSEVFQRSSIQKVISWLSRGFTAKVFQDAGSLPNHSALLAANTESAAHSDMAAHCEGSSRAIQRLSFEGSTTTTLGLFKASGLEEDTRDRGRRDTPNLTCLHACLRSEMSPKMSVLEALSPAQHCSQVGLWRSDRIRQAPTLSMDSLMGGFDGLLGDEGNLGGRTQLKEWITKRVPYLTPLLSRCV